MAPRKPTTPLPSLGEHPPGERRFSPERPETWTIEFDGHEGLDFEAYATGLRAPYLQNVTTDAATILWRVNPPVKESTLVRPLSTVPSGAPFALSVGRGGYLGYVEREVGINLGWSTRPWAQWEIRGDVNPQTGDVEPRAVALWNRAASDYLVHSRRGRGVDLGWLADTRKRNPAEWRLEGDPPEMRLENLRKGGRAYLGYGERRYGVNLGWGVRPDPANLTLAELRLDAILTWAPGGTPLEQGSRLTTADGGIQISEVSWSYLYRPTVSPETDARPALPNLRLWSQYHRPVLQCEARITGLRAGRVYHYRVESEGRDPRAPDTDTDTNTDNDNAQSPSPLSRSPRLLLADDVTFRTAPAPNRSPSVRLLAMGDLGPGKRKPSYAYDVCDLFCEVARRHDAQLWLPLGDLDNDTNGHPNAVDPFFFDVYNAYRGPTTGRATSGQISGQISGRPGRPETDVPAFANPHYFGLLGGLPTFPTFGNHDVCLQNGGSANRFRKAYQGNFVLPNAADAWCPAARDFNAAGQGYFYTFRWGRVIFVSLGLPMIKGCRVSAAQDWRRRWGRRQETALVRLLSSLGRTVSKPDVWLVTTFHDHNCGIHPPGRAAYPRLLLQHGVDLALMGHRHHFEAHDLVDGDRHLRSLVVGTGGFGDPDPGDHCRRPGFVMLDIEGDTLRYWKYDTHHCADADPSDPRPRVEGTPLGRDARHWHIREYCCMRKTGLSSHEIVEERDLNEPVVR